MRGRGVNPLNMPSRTGSGIRDSINPVTEIIMAAEQLEGNARWTPGYPPDEIAHETHMGKLYVVAGVSGRLANTTLQLLHERGTDLFHAVRYYHATQYATADDIKKSETWAMVSTKGELAVSLAAFNLANGEIEVTQESLLRVLRTGHPYSLDRA